MKNIIIIIQKEIKDLLRDKRTLMTMVVIPLLMFPLIFSVMGKIISNQIKKEQEKVLNIGVADNGNANALLVLFDGRKDIKITKYQDAAVFDSLIQSGKLDGAIVIAKDFDANTSTMKTGEVVLRYKSANWGVKDRLSEVINAYKNSVLSGRLSKLGIEKSAVDPVEVRIQDVSTVREKLGNTIGGLFPYVIIIFSFMGCMYPAIDLFTNEKERGTLETILVTPANRLEILFGKMSVVALIGLFSSFLSIIGLSFGLKQFSQGLPSDIIGTLSSLIEPGNVIMLLLMFIPLMVFFAGILTLVTTYAKSYKEAQSIISPLTIIIILPAVVGLSPGVELNAVTAIIPITNISLATKEIISGTIHFPLYGLALGSLLVYATISVLLASFWFSKERNILKA
jgi:ABC-type Na+ efflux pump, permease component